MSFEESPTSENIFDKARKISVGITNESRMPSEGFESTVGIYGGKLIVDTEGRLVLDTHGLVSQRYDIPGDSLARNYDEHVMQEPGKLAVKHPKWFLKFLIPGPKRYRGTQAEILDNITRLGLGEYYGMHPSGIEIKRPEIFRKGLVLQDIFRADKIPSNRLENIDRFQALREAGKYIREVHDQYGAIGELLSSDIIFQGTEGNNVQDPILNVPDIVWNPNKRFGGSEQKAMDILDFLINIAGEEYRRTNDLISVQKVLKSVTEGYGDNKILKVTASLAKRGRPTLTGSVFSQHNKARLGIEEENVANKLRQVIINTCQ